MDVRILTLVIAMRRMMKTNIDIIEKVNKVQNMTYKQLLADCRPKLLYYSNTQGKNQARPCFLCGETVIGKFADLEAHVRGESNTSYYGRSSFKPCKARQTDKNHAEES